jgi:uncharacterized protein (DUF362 family)
VAALPDAHYEEGPPGQAAMAQALARACQWLGWDGGSDGSFGAVIPQGARVLVKPNLVMHENQGPWGMDPLTTHPSIIRAVAQEALRARPAELLVGDAPIQACDFTRLLRSTRLDAWAEALGAREPRFKGILDFRRTTCSFVNGTRVAAENIQPEDHFVLFDLGSESLLEPITTNDQAFRVTCYDPRLLARTHAPGRHQYLITRAAMEADVIINLPKLKTHKKAGVTCALKNLVGINGNKEYLPHHRIGGAQAGGDCYPGRSLTKRALEIALDRQHMASSSAESEIWRTIERQLQRALRLTGDQLGVEGSWSGNDTVWRMSLDLNRILLYGRADGTLAEKPQRRLLHIADAVIAGQGDGPLAPQPLPLGLLLAAENAAAMDWVGSHLLGYEPAQVPIVREAFGEFRWPIATFASGEVNVMGDLGTGIADEVLSKRNAGLPVIHPTGWRDVARIADAKRTFASSNPEQAESRSSRSAKV